jgi:mannose-6-phosphate isomerase-like protein (cupin superfamily)
MSPNLPKLFFGFDEGEVIRLGPPATGQIIIKVDRNSTGSSRFLMALEVLEPGGYVPPHLHEEQEELVFVYSGRGTAVIDDGEVEMVPGTTIYLPPRVWHGITQVIGNEPLCFTLMYCPPGMEGFFRELGKLTSSEETDTLAQVAQRHGIRFWRGG